jgi:hypothetical protein
MLPRTFGSSSMCARSYYPTGPGVNHAWDHTHRLGSAAPAEGGGGQGQPMRDACVAGDLADAMRKNPRLRIFSANGLFDLATPFFITEYLGARPVRP